MTEFQLLEEWVYTANDVDGGTVITDTMLFMIGKGKERNEAIESKARLTTYEKECRILPLLEKHVNQKHPITSIIGNKFEVSELAPTGKLVITKIVKETMTITERSEFYQKNQYPIVGEI